MKTTSKLFWNSLGVGLNGSLAVLNTVIGHAWVALFCGVLSFWCLFDALDAKRALDGRP